MTAEAKKEGGAFMEHALAANIRAFRKARRLTQEQLAEVLGVTAGAVYKWESGLSVPELDLIVEMADYFDSSVDALLGYRPRDNRLDATVRRLAQYCRSREPEALTEAEKALKKYPNSFEIVHSCAQVYMVFGVGSRGRQNARRALELLEQARLLIGQNTDPEISEQTICGEIAGARLLLPQNTDPGIGELTIVGEIAGVCTLLGEYEKSVELMKRHNTNAIFSEDIGIVQSIYLNRPGEAEPYLTQALLKALSAQLDAAAGFAFVFFSRGDYASAEEILRWSLDSLRGLRKGDSFSVLDKVCASLFLLLAFTQRKTGRSEEARETLRAAREMARRFDASPDYGIGELRFGRIPEDASVYDALGTTASESMDTLRGLLGDPELDALWKEAEKDD